ncbi:hypothetical protein V8E36_007182 [Tilletia maclaganii]
MADVLAPNLNNAGLGGGAAAAGGPGAAAAAAAAAGRGGQSSILSGRRLVIYGLASTLAAAAVTFNAFRQRSNYYAAAVWLGRSNGCMLILLNFGVFSALMYALAVQYIFFGPLRAIEVEHLHERAWYALTESLLAMTIFRDEFDVKFVIMFGTLLFLKVFHWLTEDRVDYMEQTPSVSWLYHLRMVSMLSTMGLIDLCLVAWSVEAVYLDSKQLGLTIMFSTEFMILLASNFSISAKYLINCIDSFSQEVWEQKSMYVFYVDLLTDFIKLVVYTFFFAFILATYGFPFNLVRDVVFTARSFFSRVRDLIRYRKATQNMNERYPSASLADVQALSDATCIICRDDMVVAGGPGVPAGQPSAQETPKKLPCGHIFHFHCLRSWLERQQSCPTCRRTVLQSGDANAAGAPAAQRPAGAEGGGAAAAAPEAAGAGQRPPPPAPAARPTAGAAPAATGTPTPTPTRAPGADGSRPGQGPSSSSRAASSGTGTASAQRRATRDADAWTVEGGLEALRRGLERVRTEADQRRADHTTVSGRSGEFSTATPRPRGIATTPSAEDDRIPMALLEILFESSLGGERATGDLGARRAGGTSSEVVLPLAHAGGAVDRSTWAPPRPGELPVLKSTTEVPVRKPAAPSTTDNASTSAASGSTAVRTEFVRSGAPSPSTASALNSEGTVAAAEEGAAEKVSSQDGADSNQNTAAIDPEDPRKAVREAALRRFGGSTLTVPTPASAPTATEIPSDAANGTTELSTPSKGKGKEKEPDNSDNPAVSTSGPIAPGNPRLTPLSSRTDLKKLDLPFPLSLDSNAAASSVPQTLSDEALRERLLTLERLQGVISDAVDDLNRLLRPERGSEQAQL